MFQVRLTKDMVERLEKPIRGQGGYQQLLRMLASNSKAGDLSVDLSTARKIIRYVEKYGRGGFQTRLRAVAASLARQID